MRRLYVATEGDWAFRIAQVIAIASLVGQIVVLLNLQAVLQVASLPLFPPWTIAIGGLGGAAFWAAFGLQSRREADRPPPTPWMAIAGAIGSLIVTAIGFWFWVGPT